MLSDISLMNPFENPEVFWYILSNFHRAKLCLMKHFYKPLNRRPCTDPECIFYHQMLHHIMVCYLGNRIHENCLAIRIIIAHCDHCSGDECILCFRHRDYIDSSFFTSFGKLYIMCLSPEWIRPNIHGCSDQQIPRIEQSPSEADWTPLLLSLLRDCWLCDQTCSMFDTQSGRMGW